MLRRWQKSRRNSKRFVFVIVVIFVINVDVFVFVCTENGLQRHVLCDLGYQVVSCSQEGLYVQVSRGIQFAKDYRPTIRQLSYPCSSNSDLVD